MHFGNVKTTSTTYRKSAVAVFFIGVVLALTACSDSDSGDNSETPFVATVDPNDVVPAPSSENMSDFLRQNMDYGTILRLLEEADLVGDLQGDNMGMGWTLFAPRDDAFGESMSPEQEIALIKLHIYSGTLAYADLAPGNLVMTQGSVEVVQKEDGTPSVGGATIEARDRVVANGVIHFVDSVLVPLQ